MPAGAKLAAPPSTMLLLSLTFFIILSEVQGHQCHWCGPLAEQVHRSRRAPPCHEHGDHLATCDPGYPYCAIVATSPPYVESRYCVKIYQDECYPLFCNSTKTWRMTCPCRGDLCNGANAEREIDSFAVLSKLVAKTHNSRIKKRSTETESLSTGDSLAAESTTNELTNNVEGETVEERSIANNKILNKSDVLVYVPGDELNIDTNNLDEEIITNNQEESTNTTSNIEISDENEVDPNVMQADEPMKVPLDVKAENIVNNRDTSQSDPNVSTRTPDITIEKQATTLKMQITSEVHVPLVKPTKATNDFTENRYRENETKEKLPTAEALQHNENQLGQSTVSDSEVKEADIKSTTSADTTVPYTTASSLLTTLVTNTINRPTNVSPKEGKNSATMLTGHMLSVFSICLLRITL